MLFHIACVLPGCGCNIAKQGIIILILIVLIIEQKIETVCPSVLLRV